MNSAFATNEACAVPHLHKCIPVTAALLGVEVCLHANLCPTFFTLTFHKWRAGCLCAWTPFKESRLCFVVAKAWLCVHVCQDQGLFLLMCTAGCQHLRKPL